MIKRTKDLMKKPFSPKRSATKCGKKRPKYVSSQNKKITDEQLDGGVDFFQVFFFQVSKSCDPE